MLCFIPMVVGGLIAAFAIGPTAFACNHGAVGTTSVSEVYPTADVLPENLLRFYVYFSAPMRRDGVHTSIALLDSAGAPIPAVFLANQRPLWSPDGRRLTLVLDPGRVKSGLDAHEALGRALVAGERYTLSIDARTLDSEGCQLAGDFTKEFQTSEADLTIPDLDEWTLAAPTAGTREGLDLRLNGSHDHVSLAYRIRVRDSAGAVLAGSIALADHEQVWRFTPRAPWRHENYALVIDTRFEDTAGNRLTGLFDRPAADGRTDLLGRDSVELPFVPAP